MASEQVEDPPPLKVARRVKRLRMPPVGPAAPQIGSLVTASRGSPVRGSSTPGVPITKARNASGEIPAAPQAVTTAPRTSSTGSPVPTCCVSGGIRTS